MPRRERRTGNAKAIPTTCPCGTGKPYADCCGALHSGQVAAATAEQLMRSRYSAFAVQDGAYLLKSHHSSTRPKVTDFEPKLRWTGLEIVGTTGGSAFHTEGTVEFIAHYTEAGHDGSMRENSSFVREDGNWVYLSAF
ncbi:SEC-C domain-containing protein [Catenulispora sp. NF23]|uniref:YchJ family protein n=1 Tax=Catenulispora pinistramenti TaxID=2705254 RepID=UPI001BA526FF|nr:YchJ family metal-binding protein [Catenulispora pinistramenti]MBS2536583.1 SEC-C domain-containing protein [Catenulispora pinistramenti]